MALRCDIGILQNAAAAAAAAHQTVNAEDPWHICSHSFGCHIKMRLSEQATWPRCWSYVNKTVYIEISLPRWLGTQLYELGSSWRRLSWRGCLQVLDEQLSHNLKEVKKHYMDHIHSTLTLTQKACQGQKVDHQSKASRGTHSLTRYEALPKCSLLRLQLNKKWITKAKLWIPWMVMH